jgi:hypothetical protein
MTSLHTDIFAAIQSGTFVQQSVAQQPPYANSYAPAHVQCPQNTQFVRPADGLSQAEAEWVQGRKQVVATALGEYLERLKIKHFDVSEYIAHLNDSNFEDVPIMGLAISGGGWASAYTGVRLHLRSGESFADMSRRLL